MKPFLSICLAFTSMLVQAQLRVDSNFHVYLLIGQSNMAGRGPVDSGSTKANTRILMLDKEDHWSVATDPVHFDKPNVVGVGPGISFAQKMLKGNRNLKIGLIPCALGGSPIKVWEPGAVYLKNFHPYDNAIKRAKIAMEQGVLKGVLWHQGESDNDPQRAARYMEKLKTLISRLRTDLQQPHLPFVAGEIGYFNKVHHINPVIKQLPGEVSFTAVVSAKGLKDKGYGVHFDTTSARELGKRYAQAMKRIRTPKAANKPTHTSAAKTASLIAPIVVLCFDDAEISHYTIVAPLLKKYGFGATFFVCEMPWKTPADSAYYMKWPQIAELHKMGFEIGNHTGHHRNMTKLTREEMQQEVRYIEGRCREYGIPKPVSFAYPGNRADSLSQSVLKEMGYSYARAGGSTYYDPKIDVPVLIPSYTMGSTEKLGERTGYALRNLQPGQVLVFTIHGVPDIAHPDYTTSAEVFADYLRYMKERNFTVIAIRDLEKYISTK